MKRLYLSLKGEPICEIRRRLVEEAQGSKAPIQKLTDQYVHQVDQILKKKEDEILEV